jgi:hypothetical protein
MYSQLDLQRQVRSAAASEEGQPGQHKSMCAAIITMIGCWFECSGITSRLTCMAGESRVTCAHRHFLVTLACAASINFLERYHTFCCWQARAENQQESHADRLISFHVVCDDDAGVCQRGLQLISTQSCFYTGRIEAL